MYEHHSERLLPRRKFAGRVLQHLAIAFFLVGGALSIGVSGYHFIAGLPLVDSILDASMILGGMGPVDPLVTTAAKLFASAYALFSGLVFIGVLGILILPFAHRVMHKLHLEDAQGD